MRERNAVAVAGLAVAVVCVGAAGGGVTYARFSDHRSINGNKVSARVWQPPPPKQCGPLSHYWNVIYGTHGNDVIHGDEHPQIIMGLGGNDTIYAGNPDDCIVGGDGDDKLYGDDGQDDNNQNDNKKQGDNSQGDSTGNGGSDGNWLHDICLGGNGNNTFVNCVVQQ